MYKIILVALVLTACARPQQPRAVPLSELRTITVSDSSCKNMDQSIRWLEYQQHLKGIPPTMPELLNEHDREYQARIRVMVWAIRIGCANPDRYRG